MTRLLRVWQTPDVSDDVAGAYDAVAELYAERFIRDLADDADARPWVEAFVDLVDPSAGPVLDAGCGPGHGVDFLGAMGVRVVGIDLSPGLVAQARSAFPDVDVRLGDFTRLEFDDGSLGGIFSRYSIIHLPPARLAEVFAEWARALRPDGPVLLSFFASLRGGDHGASFDHAVTTAYELFPETVAEQLASAGFDRVRSGTTPPVEGGRPLGKGVVLAQRIGR